MRRLLYTLVALFVVAAIAALVVPRFIDWTRYKPEFARQLEAASGRRTAIDGEISLQLLPNPTLRATNVRIANVEGAADPEIARIASLEMRLDFWSLLGGRIVGTSVTLVRPTVSLEILEPGRANWLLGAGSRSRLIERLTVRGGTIRYRNLALGQDWTVRGAELRLDYDRLSKTRHVRGSVLAGRAKLAVRIALGASKKGLSPLHFSIGHLDSNARATFRGTASLGRQGPRLAGKAHAESARLRKLIGAVAPGARLADPGLGWLLGKFELDADLSLAGSEVGFDRLKLRLDDLAASGSADISLAPSPRYRLAVNFARLDIDRLIARRRAAGNKSRLRFFRLLENGTLTLDIGVNALVYRREIIRKAKLRAVIGGAAARLESLTAQLPGATEIVLGGRLDISGDDARFDGRFSLNAANLRGVLDWLGVDVSRVPADRLRRAAGRGRIKASRLGIEVFDSILDLDTSRLAGRWSLRLAGRPKARMVLRIDRLDLDAYLPRQRPRPRKTAKQKNASAAGKRQAKPARARWRGPLDAEFDLRFGVLSYGGQTARAASIDGSFQRGVLYIKKASVSGLGGVSGTVLGTVRGLPGRANFDLRFDGRAAALARAISLAGIKAPPALDRLGAVTAKGVVSGTRDLVKIGATIGLAGGEIELSGDLVPRLVGGRYDLKFSLAHARLGDLVKLFDWAPNQGGKELGAVSVSATAIGNLAAASFSDIKATLGGVPINGAVKLEFARIRPRLTGQLQTGALTWEQILAAPAALVAMGNRKNLPQGFDLGKGWPTGAFNFDGLKLLDAELLVRPAAIAIGAHKIEEPLIELILRDGVLDLRRLTGRLFGGDLALKIKLSASPKPGWQATLTMAGADLSKAAGLFAGQAFTGGHLDLEAELTANGSNLREMVASLAGSVSLEMRQGIVRGFDLAGINQRIAGQADSIGLINLLTSGMTSGETRFTALSGKMTVRDGIGRFDDLALRAVGGAASARGKLDFIRRRIDGGAEFRFAAIPQSPPLRVNISGPAGGLRAVFRFNELQRYLLTRRRK
ncbi:MAG: AsmA family protein [Alphaproteobacteria bacterium]